MDLSSYSLVGVVGGGHFMMWLIKENCTAEQQLKIRHVYPDTGLTGEWCVSCTCVICFLLQLSELYVLQILSRKLLDHRRGHD